MTTPTTPAADALIEHAGFLRAVAQATLRGDDLVDDVVQDTYVTGLERAQSRRGPLRAWLGGIARRKALAANRRRAAVLRREARAARPESVPPTVESGERIASLRRVTQAILALPEQYREVLVLRFYDDLPPRAVARQLQIPVETVRTRVRRGLALLRDRLEAEARASGWDWRAVLVPLAYPSGSGAKGIVGPLVWICSALVVASISGWWMLGDPVPGDSTEPVRAARAGAEALAGHTPPPGGTDPVRIEETALPDPVFHAAAGELVEVDRSCSALGVPTSEAAPYTQVDQDGDGRSVSWMWLGKALRVTCGSTVPSDSHADISILTDFGKGFEEVGGGASGPDPPDFNGGVCTMCLDAIHLDTGAPLRIVVTFFDASENPLAKETVSLNLP